MMNILWISHFVPYPPKAGMLTRSYNLLREVSRYHNIYLIALIQEKPLRTMFKNTEEGLIEAKQNLSGFCKSVEFLNISRGSTRLGKYIIATGSLLSTSSYSVEWLRSDSMQQAIDSILEEKDIHAIHADTISLAPYVENIKNRTMLLTHHNIESHMMLRRAEGTNNWLKKLYYYIEGKKLEKYERKVCPLFSVNITCSPLDSERLSNVCSGLYIMEIPNGVDTNYFKPQQLDVVPYSLIFAGGLNWYPNLSAMEFFVYEVWPLLKEKCNNVVMDIIGQDPSQDLLDLSKSDPSLRIHGFVDDVRPYISRAAVYVCPISYSGGTKLKVLDALAMEKAIVANPVSCEGIDVENGKSVLYAIEPEEYVECIVKLFENDNLRVSMGKRGRQQIKELYSYENIGKRLSELYTSASRK